MKKRGGIVFLRGVARVQLSLMSVLCSMQCVVYLCLGLRRTLGVRALKILRTTVTFVSVCDLFSNPYAVIFSFFYRHFCKDGRWVPFIVGLIKTIDFNFL